MSEPEFNPRHLSPEPSSWPFAELLVNSALCLLPHPVTRGFSCDSADKESSCNVGDLGSIPGLGRSLGEGNDYPLQYSGLENSVEYIGVTESWTQLSNFHLHGKRA